MTRTHSYSERGFTLVEMAIVMVIAGVILVAAITLALPLLKEARLVGTEAKMDKVAKAIDFYATHNYRVPCPAQPKLTTTGGEPFGFEQGSGASGSTVPTTCGTPYGIIPFKTLGLPADWARDAWGDYISYSISPAFSLDTTDNTILVHERCRTADWFDARMTYEPGYLQNGDYSNLNPRKARFCCPYPPGDAPATDLTILDAAGNSQLAVSRTTGNMAAYLTQADTPYGVTTTAPIVLQPNQEVPEADGRPTAPVYILISHGPNGFGAYNVNTGTRTSNAAATLHEQSNSNDATLTKYEIPSIDRKGTEMKFDDLVVWRSQDLIFADQGATCSLP